MPSLNTRLIWSLIAVFAVADAIGLKIAGIAVVPAVLWGITVRLMFLLVLALFYTYRRPDLRIATLAHSIAAILSSIVVMGIFSYLTVISGRPLIDAQLVAMDHALGLDWPTAYNWVVAHPLIYKGLFVIYCSLVPQLLVLVFVLNSSGRFERCWETLWLYMIASIMTLPFSALWPAAGAFGYFHIHNGEPYVNACLALRDGTFKTFGTGPILGVIQFPSLHAAATVILPYAARGLKYSFIFFLILNILMLASTPFIGGHHFSDLWGGIALAVVTIFIVRKVLPVA